MMAKARKVEVVTGEEGQRAHALSVGERVIRFDKAIIAAGLKRPGCLFCRTIRASSIPHRRPELRRCPSACW